MNPTKRLRHGVNIDHVATLRQARGVTYPDPLEAAVLVKNAAADSLTIHLREDRRHIQDHDLQRIRAWDGLPVNLEMAITEEMLGIAIDSKPAWVCLVPEKREELTTEGGLDVAGQLQRVREACERLQVHGIQVSLFVDADPEQITAASACRADAVELHTGHYAEAKGFSQTLSDELARIRDGAEQASVLGLNVHAGHGLTLANVGPIAAIPEIVELNNGHSIIARSVFVGLQAAVEEMRAAMDAARPVQ